ncbi:MAG TPA: nitronate monooxygenase [Chthoniobacterales bacterium]|nr:nitronate monooxygenase [Chthoniobacterales bacterium]
MLITRFTRLIGCDVPIQQAGMGGVATAELASALALAGALGMIGGVRLGAKVLDEELDSLPRQTRSRIGVNFLVPFLDRESLEVAASRVRVVEFFFGEPDADLVERAHGAGALAAWQVGSVEEARAAAGAGCDFLVAQGIEAGGHVRGRIGLLPLLDGVLDAVNVPVLAAGGIATARAMAAALAAGADGVRVGTRFVAAAESAAHPAYQEALLRAEPEDTILTEAYSANWPNAPHRVLRGCIEAAQALTDDLVGQTVIGGATQPLTRFMTPPPTRWSTGKIEAMPHYAGQSVGAVQKIQPAADIVRELAEGAERLLRGVKD